MKYVFLVMSLFFSQLSISATCPNKQTCYQNPETEGYQFLAVTATEAEYAYYASYPGYASYASYPSNVMKRRANKVCKFLGHDSAAFAKAGDYTWDDLLEVDRSGYAHVVNASYSPNTAFSKLNCK